jgi:nucleoside-diphosphate-sugar epimerase
MNDPASLLKGMPVLVTGAAGWLGKRLCERLSNLGATVRALVLPGQEAALRDLGPLVVPVVGDLRRREDCFRCCAEFGGDILLHAAGVIHPRRISEFYEVNVAGTRNMLEAACAAGLRRAVVVSSNSPCGCNPHPDHLFDEESPYNPYRHYGRAKMLMELEAKKIHAQGRMETVLVRAPWFYGPGQPARQSLFFTMIKEGKAPVVGDGSNMRSMAYIDNLADGIFLAATAEKAGGQTYWIADERPYSWMEIIDTIGEVLSRDFGMTVVPRCLRLPGFTGTVAGWADAAIQACGFYHGKIHVLSETNKSIACSVQKAQRELGYIPAVALREGMRRSVAWCLNQGLKI